MVFASKVMAVWESSLPFTDAFVLTTIPQIGPAKSIPTNWEVVPSVALLPATVQKTFCAKAPFIRWIVTPFPNVKFWPN